MRNFLVSLVSLAVLASPAVAADKPVVKIGASFSLTGDNAMLGEGGRNAMMLAKENISPDTKYTYEIVVEDDGLEAKRAAAATNKLISVDKVDAMTSFSSGTGGVISPITEQNKVIHIGIASAQSVADGDFNFIHWTTPTEEARAMGEALKERGIKKVAVIGLNHPAFLEIRDRLKEGLANSETKIISDSMTNPGEKDFRSIIAKAKAEEPDLYLLLFFNPEIEIVAKQLREAGIQTAMSSIESFGLSNEKDLFEGQWYVDAADPNKAFLEQYEAKFKSTPPSGAPNAYDAVKLIVYAYENTPAADGVKPTPTEVAKTLQGVKDLPGVLGKLSVDEKGVVFSPATVKTIKNGKPETISATN